MMEAEIQVCKRLAPDADVSAAAAVQNVVGEGLRVTVHVDVRRPPREGGVQTSNEQAHTGPRALRADVQVPGAFKKDHW